jgi:TetR/AcrR family transcriptional regulator, regulator of cefoperazone and chloramphenicol sensitivity
MLAHELQKNAACRRLIAAASEEFAQHGFTSARVRAIAESARVNLAAVNYYFGGKEGLYRATLSYLSGQAKTVRPAPNKRGLTPEQRLYRRIYGLLERFLGSTGPSMLGRIVAHEAMNPTANLDGVMEEMLRPELERMVAAVHEIAGPNVPNEEVMHTAIGVLGQCLLYQFARPAIQRLYPPLPEGAELCKALARHITDMTLAGIECLRLRHANPTQTIEKKMKTLTAS